MARQYHGADRQGRYLIGAEHVSVRREQSTPAIQRQGVIAHARKIKQHLVDFRVAIAAHRHDSLGNAVEHLCHLLRRVAVGQGIARPVVEQISQKYHLVGRLVLDAFHQCAAPIRRSVNIRCYKKFHAHSSRTPSHPSRIAALVLTIAAYHSECPSMRGSARRPTKGDSSESRFNMKRPVRRSSGAPAVLF